ncbi:MAG: GTP pyrophosphokinase family protein, partial [Oscillospiraceae bacterium]
TDYIEAPKPNGYRSLHLVLLIPVFFSERTENIKVEVQIRTIAMDFWASLEHQLHYKANGEIPLNISNELKECADIISQTDVKMQNIHDKVDKIM